MVQAGLPFLRRARGRIVNITSVSGKVAPPLMAPYVAAKHGLEGLSDVLRLELGAFGMHLSVIEPGWIATAMGGKLQRDTAEWLRLLPAEGRAAYGAALEAMADTISREAAHGSSPDCGPGRVSGPKETRGIGCCEGFRWEGFGETLGA
jgi:NAD(P)-dependent dehydrogenase (short-subunit alcohol dehydrogenase family)